MTNNAPFAGAADAQSHFVSVGASRIHYVTAGKGSHVIVFVHCWAGNLGFWREQVPALADQARLVLIDLPGHGRSDKPQTAYTMDFFAGAVLAVLRDARVDKAAFIGHSMGAAVLCRVHHQAPEKITALVSVDCCAARPARPNKPRRWWFRSARRNISTTPGNSSAPFFPFPAPRRCATA
jgi:pimeloyl-ACP methyl ester carboxylesterase